MNTLVVAVGALGSGIPDGNLGALVTAGLGWPGIVAGLGAFVACTLGVLVVHRLQSAGDVPPNSATSHGPGGDEIRKAA